MAKQQKPRRGYSNATKESKREPKHARIYLLEAQSAAYRSLSLGARALLIELKLLFNGTNNGFIALGERQAAKLLNCHRETARGYFAELEDRGFIRARRRGGFTCKTRVSTDWSLTEHGINGRQPRRDFMRWQPPAVNNGAGNPASAAATKPATGRKIRPVRTENPSREAPNGAENPSRETPFSLSNGTENPSNNSLPSTRAEHMNTPLAEVVGPLGAVDNPDGARSKRNGATPP